MYCAMNKKRKLYSSNIFIGVVDTEVYFTQLSAGEKPLLIFYLFPITNCNHSRDSR